MAFHSVSTLTVSKLTCFRFIRYSANLYGCSPTKIKLFGLITSNCFLIDREVQGQLFLRQDGVGIVRMGAPDMVEQVCVACSALRALMGALADPLM